jgi:phytoene dehydrogenase-like protein
LIGLASLPLFHPDPGRLSAATVHAGLRAAYVDGRVRYVLGGFGALVGLLARRAREVGVVIITESPVDALPPTPCVLAVDLGAARRLTGDDSLGWPAEPVGLLDLVVNESRSDAVASLDLDDHVWANQYSRYDRTLTPDGTVLVQAHAGLRNGESMQGAVARIERMLDRHFEGWRERVHWRRDHIRRDGATPADPPGTTWRDRPSPSRGDGLWVVNDRVARPGLLSSVSVSAALSAVADLCADPTAAAADASGEWR